MLPPLPVSVLPMAVVTMVQCLPCLDQPTNGSPSTPSPHVTCTVSYPPFTRGPSTTSTLPHRVRSFQRQVTVSSACRRERLNGPAVPQVQQQRRLASASGASRVPRPASTLPALSRNWLHPSFVCVRRCCRCRSTRRSVLPCRWRSRIGCVSLTWWLVASCTRRRYGSLVAPSVPRTEPGVRELSGLPRAICTRLRGQQVARATLWWRGDACSCVTCRT
mmetsp:Transcript_16337/g.51119  ORF Transcript_16337/g.51119 Transcript_16337/m.51119 type:complete len:219 (-) Transcript_16337:1652-2308(-)